VLVLIIVGVLVVLLAIGLAMDVRSRRVRGRGHRVRVPGGELGHKAGLVAGRQLSQFDAGTSLIADAQATGEEKRRAD
jgi:hypothetical protein